jgi:uracil-DNA glycosylase
VIVCLGQLGWNAALQQARRREWFSGKLPKFGHGACAALAGGRTLLGSYHPSQQNTFTGKLTEPMFDAVFAAARKLLEAETP